MTDKSIFKMVTSIISASINSVFMPLVIVFYTLYYDSLSIVLVTLFYSFIIPYFIIKAIYSILSLGTCKNILKRIKNVLLDISLCLIISHFLLYSFDLIRWIVFGIVVSISLFNIFIDSFDKLRFVKKILLSIIFLILLITLFSTFYYTLFVLLGIIGFSLLYIGNIFNKSLFSLFDIFASILIGLFILFI